MTHYNILCEMNRKESKKKTNHKIFAITRMRIKSFFFSFLYWICFNLTVHSYKKTSVYILIGDCVCVKRIKEKKKNKTHIHIPSSSRTANAFKPVGENQIRWCTSKYTQHKHTKKSFHFHHFDFVFSAMSKMRNTELREKRESQRLTIYMYIEHCKTQIEQAESERRRRKKTCIFALCVSLIICVCVFLLFSLLCSFSYIWFMLPSSWIGILFILLLCSL